eukprot:UN15488
MGRKSRWDIGRSMRQKCFFESLLLRGANHKWGNFSKSIPRARGLYGVAILADSSEERLGLGYELLRRQAFQNECLDVKQKGREPFNRYDFVLLNDPTGTYD